MKGLKRRSRYSTVTENLTVITDRVGACRVSCSLHGVALGPCSVGVADEDLTGGKATLLPVPALQVTSLLHPSHAMQMLYNAGRCSAAEERKAERDAETGPRL